MFLQFFFILRSHSIPVSLREYLTLLDALKAELATDVDGFYSLARTILIKHEEHLDTFDKLFSEYVNGSAKLKEADLSAIQEEWLKREMEINLTEEEKALIEALGSLDELAERFRQLLEEQNPDQNKTIKKVEIKVPEEDLQQDVNNKEGTPQESGSA